MWNKLEEREKLVLLAGAGLLIILLLGNLLMKIYEYRTELSEQVVETRSGFTQLDKYIKDYAYYKSLKSGDGDDANTIYKKLDPIMMRYNIKDKVFTQRDSSNVILKNYNKVTIELSFKSVILNDVFKMIYDIEINKQINCKVEHMNFRKPLAGKEVYDVNLRLASYSKIK